MRYSFPLSPWNQQRQFEKPVWVYPAHLAMYATYLRDKGEDVVWDSDIVVTNEILDHKEDVPSTTIKDDYQIDVPFIDLPYPDREFTDALNPMWQSYGNYKFHPATHMMVSNLCWYGKCTFCVDTKKLQEGEGRGVRSVDHVMEEIDDLIRLGYKEVFDDSGTFPVGSWLEEFCAKMREKDRYKKITIGCNMKPIKLDYKMMANAGFRFLLVGIESANQKTVDRIKKGQRCADIIPIFKSMSDAGLEPHITSMFGYEWEDHHDAMRTVKLVHYLLKNGYAKTAQASVYSPPRTQPDPNSKGHKYIPMIYDAYKSPKFWYQKIKDIKRWEDFTYIVRGGRLVVEEKWRKLCFRLGN
jgi:radical SAM superfamily enzyme YgiQ (UPF0313 family)